MENIYVIGFMGSGKTTAGRELARLMGRAFIDTDAFIEERAGMTIRRMFALYGEDAFRQAETQALLEACRTRRSVVSTGGGIVKDPRNVAVMRETGFVAYIRSSARRILENTATDDSRPLLSAQSAEDRLERIKALLSERESLYLSACHKAVDVSQLTPIETARAIMDLAKA